MVVERCVDRGRVDRDIRVGSSMRCHALGRGEQAGELDVRWRRRRLTRSTAATAELAVASIGSTMITGRSAMSVGTL